MRAALILALVAGCSSLHLQRPPRIVEGHVLAAAPPSPACIKLARRSFGWTLTGIAFGAAGSGASGLAGAFDNLYARYSLLGSAAVFSLVGAIGGYVGGWYAARFSRECS